MELANIASESPSPSVINLISDPLPQCLGLKLLESTAAIETASGPITILLRTDSARLHKWFRLNWRMLAPERDNVASDATVYALVNSPQFYGVPSTALAARFWCEHERTLFCFGTESYSVLKVSIRGACSAVCNDVTTFTHGCTFEIEGGGRTVGVLLLGASGAGKTTLMSSLLSRQGLCVRIVNDDWGSIDIETKIARATGESLLHMKWQSVQAFRRDLRRADLKYWEEFSDRPTTLISPRVVFGSGGVAESTNVTHVVMLTRELTRAFMATAGGLTADIIEAGAYSPYYRSAERFLNGALILAREDHWAKHREAFEGLLAGLENCTINNSGSSGLMVDAFLELVELV